MTSFVGLQLTNLWKEILSTPPPTNTNKLWEEHLLIREQLASFSNNSDFVHKFEARADAIKPFLLWAEKMGIEHSGVEICTWNSNKHLSLATTKDFEEDSLVVSVPNNAVLSADYAQHNKVLKSILDNDEMIRAMDNVGLVIILAFEILSEDESQWKPYLDLLPTSYTTPIFYNIEQLQTLKPSGVFEEALNMYRAVARQFVYFYLRILSDYNSADIKNYQKMHHRESFSNGVTTKPFYSSPFNPGNFTFDLYRWCVSTVSTRINMVPSTKLPPPTSEEGPIRMIPALIPFIDLANHEHTSNNSGSVFLDSESGNVHLQIHKNLPSSTEILIHYGARSNSKFLLHNGFVPENPNPDNIYELKIGLPKTPANEFKRQFLESVQILPYSGQDNSVYLFGLVEKTTPTSHDDDTEKLWQFGKIFMAKSSMELSLENNKELNERAKKFICDRLRLLLSAMGSSQISSEYPPKNDLIVDSDEAIIATSIWRLKFGEKSILTSCLDYFSLLSKI